MKDVIDHKTIEDSAVPTGGPAVGGPHQAMSRASSDSRYTWLAEIAAQLLSQGREMPFRRRSDRILFLTPGVFCPHATAGCLALSWAFERKDANAHPCPRPVIAAPPFTSGPRAFHRYWPLKLAFSGTMPADLDCAHPPERFNDLPWETLHRHIFHQLNLKRMKINYNYFRRALHFLV